MGMFLETSEQLAADSGPPYPTLAHYMAWPDRLYLLQLLIQLCNSGAEFTHTLRKPLTVSWSPVLNLARVF
jgi:hypothetical protein